MSQLPAVDLRGEAPSVNVSKVDLVTVWSVLENLAVSLDQIGGINAGPINGSLEEERRLALLEALGSYLSPDLVAEINKARVSLGKYVEDEEAESLSEKIRYWDYATPKG